MHIITGVIQVHKIRRREESSVHNKRDDELGYFYTRFRLFFKFKFYKILLKLSPYDDEITLVQVRGLPLYLLLPCGCMYLHNKYVISNFKKKIYFYIWWCARILFTFILVNYTMSHSFLLLLYRLKTIFKSLLCYN